MALNIPQLKQFVGEHFDKEVLPVISKYIEIPNQSPAFDPHWATNGYMDQAINLITDWIKTQNVPNLTLEIIRLPERTPIIFMTLPGSSSDSPTVLLYGHMDKQPPLAEHLWKEGLHPYKPVIRDGKLYGRGGADDGYSSFSCILALKAIQAQGVAHPRCVIVIEAREESGSQDLPTYMDHLKERIGTPSLIVCLDSGCGTYDQFWMTSSLRGCIVGTLNVKILKESAHSGAASGVVPSSFRIIRKLLERIEDVDTGKVLVPSLNKPIPEARIQQAKESAAILGASHFLNDFQFVEGSKAMHTDCSELILNRAWRATVSYTGVDGIPSIANAGNVLRTDTSLKLSIRVPPHVDATVAAQEVKEILEKDAPYGAHVSFSGIVAMPGWESPLLSEWLEKAVAETGMAVFGKKHAYMGEGGSIPFMGMLAQKFPKAQFVITGILGPGSNAHGPNEFLHIEMTKNVTATVAALLVEQNKRK